MEDKEIDWKTRALEATVRADEVQRCLREAIAVAVAACYPVPSDWRKAAGLEYNIKPKERYANISAGVLIQRERTGIG